MSLTHKTYCKIIQYNKYIRVLRVRMCMRACAHMCVRVCMRELYLFITKPTHTHARVCACAPTHTHTHTHKCMYLTPF